ncbi:hypothetical protein [Methanobrevibacter arboriphilus]|nr:hypothetical protein [Methanobrevibacter arboriphilus]
MCSPYKWGKCPAAWKTSVRMFFSGSPSELKKVFLWTIKVR